MWGSALRFSAVGLELAINIVVGTGFGWWLDGKLDTKPYLALVGLLLGVAAGVKTLVRVTREFNRLDEKEDEGDKKP